MDTNFASQHGVHTVALMATLSELPSGRFRVRFVDATGTRNSSTFETKVQAERFIKNLSAPAATAKRMRFDHFVKQWWPSYVKRVRPQTANGRRIELNTHVLPKWGSRFMDDIDREEIEQWLSLFPPGVRPGVLKATRQVFNEAERAGIIASTPTRGLRLPTTSRAPIRVLTMPEVHRLAEAIEGRYRALVLLMAYCGLRPSEAYALKPEFLDLKTNELAVRHSLDNGGRIGPPKNDSAYRTIIFPSQLGEEMAQHLRLYPPTGPYVFETRTGKPLTSARIVKDFKLAVTKAGLSESEGRISPHVMRHSAITEWLRNGVNPVSAAKRSGHTSTKVLLDTYGHAIQADDAMIAKQLEQSWNAATEAEQA